MWDFLMEGPFNIDMGILEFLAKYEKQTDININIVIFGICAIMLRGWVVFSMREVQNKNLL